MSSKWALRWVAVTISGLILATGVAAGHVRYVSDDGESGDGVAFLITALTDPVNAAVLGFGTVAIFGGLALYVRYQPFERDVAVFRDVMTDYRDLLPWLVRLGFGLPLVGAGFSGYFFVPVFEPTVGFGSVRLFQIGLGFALLFGLATRVAAIAGVIAYCVTAVFELTLLFSMEWVPGFIVLVLVGSGRPSADQTFKRIATAEGTWYGKIDPIHTLSEYANAIINPYERFVPVVIRVGIGISFIFLGLFEKLLAPDMAFGVVEQYGLAAMTPLPADLWVLGAGLAEIGLGTAILLGFFTRIASLTALAVFTLTLFALPDDPVLAHIGLYSLGSALLITGAGPFALDNRIGGVKPSLSWREPTPSTD